MPQIDAPTVAEHRAQQREALLDAAEAILLEEGHGALSFRRARKRTGLARNSIYRYFGSRDDLIAALCERDMPRWLEELESAMAAAADADGRVAAFVSTQLQLVAHGSHRMAQLLGDAPLGPAVRARINALAYRPAVLLGAGVGARRRPRRAPGRAARPGRRERGRAAPARRRNARRGGAADRHARADARALTRSLTRRRRAGRERTGHSGSRSGCAGPADGERPVPRLPGSHPVRAQAVAGTLRERADELAAGVDDRGRSGVGRTGPADGERPRSTAARQSPSTCSSCCRDPARTR